MRIKKLQIRNFKSLVDFELEDLKPFCAFVGPNASGKSNIFEALEFVNYLIKYTHESPRFFGGLQSIYSYNSKPLNEIIQSNFLLFDFEFEDEIVIDFIANFIDNDHAKDLFATIATGPYPSRSNISQLNSLSIRDLNRRKDFIRNWKIMGNAYEGDFEQFADNFSRIFVGKESLKRTPPTNTKLSPDASNLSQIIGNIFQNQERRSDFIEWLRILIPEFKNIEVKKSNIDGSYDFVIYEKGSDKPFPRNLISDGTHNILSLMAAVYQTDQPQFLCVEEPENGLHPQAIELLVDFFREKCEEEGHHIWLNTHSQTLVRCLEIDEIILINKVDGATKAKQHTNEDKVNIKTDEAWLSNALGGGVLWSK